MDKTIVPFFVVFMAPSIYFNATEVESKGNYGALFQMDNTLNKLKGGEKNGI